MDSSKISYSSLTPYIDTDKRLVPIVHKKWTFICLYIRLQEEVGPPGLEPGTKRL